MIHPHSDDPGYILRVNSYSLPVRPQGTLPVKDEAQDLEYWIFCCHILKKKGGFRIIKLQALSFKNNYY